MGGGSLFNVEEVEEGVRGMGVVPAERLQTELPVHEDDGISGLEEVLCGRSAAGALKRGIDLGREEHRKAQGRVVRAEGEDIPALKLSRKRTLRGPQSVSRPSPFPTGAARMLTR